MTVRTCPLSSVKAVPVPVPVPLPDLPPVSTEAPLWSDVPSSGDIPGFEMLPDRPPQGLLRRFITTQRHLIALAQSGSFTRAAEALFLTQPALSRCSAHAGDGVSR